MSRYEPRYSSFTQNNRILVETHTHHDETTLSVMNWFLSEREKTLKNSCLAIQEKERIKSYCLWLKSIKKQLRGNHIPKKFKLVYLTCNDLGITSQDLRNRTSSGRQGVTTRKVRARLNDFNHKHNLNLKPCRPIIPFLLKKLDFRGAPFHHAFIGTGLYNANGHKINIHYHAPLDFTFLSSSRFTDIIAYEYYNDGYWEPGLAQTFVFEC